MMNIRNEEHSSLRLLFLSNLRCSVLSLALFSRGILRSDVMRICTLTYLQVINASVISLLTCIMICRPMKKKSGVIAGIARMGGGRDSPVGYGHMDDNEDVRQKTFPTFSFSNLPHIISDSTPFL